jgi:hypothetical protein
MCVERINITRCQTCEKVIMKDGYIEVCPGGLYDYKKCTLGYIYTKLEYKEECDDCKKVREEEERKKRLAK